MSHELAFALQDAAALDRVSAQLHPRGMKARCTAHRLLRETYFDTTDAALREQGLALRLVQSADAEPALEVERLAPAGPGGAPPSIPTLTAPLEGGGLYAALRGPSELAALVRSVTDPAALRPTLARDVDREEWEIRGRWLSRSVCRIRLDRIVAHHGGCSQPRWEAVMVAPPPQPPVCRIMLTHLRQVHGLEPDGGAAVDRALASFPGLAPPGPAVGVGHRVVAVVVADGHVALVEGEWGMTLPSVPGSGETAALSAASEVADHAGPAPEAELLGTAPLGPGGGEVEAWLVEEPRGCRRVAQPPCHWIPLPELLERVGAPGLRDRSLVTALLLLVTSDVGARRLEELAGPRGEPLVLPMRRRRPPVDPGEDPLDFLDLELGILDFNLRVLELAEDPDVPLLERVRFLSIVASNLDEFFVVRAGRLRRTDADGRRGEDAVPFEPDLRDLVAIRARALVARQGACLRRLLLPALECAGTRLLTWADLDDGARATLADHFETHVLPVLTPQALTGSAGQPFPHLESLRLSLAVVLHEPGTAGGPLRLGHVGLPTDLPRFLQVPGTKNVIPLEQVVGANVASLFPGLQVAGVHGFRVTRTGDVEIDEGAADSLLMAMEDEVEARPFKPAVRLEVQRGTPREVVAYILRNLRQERGVVAGGLDHSDVFEVDAPLDLRGLARLTTLDVPDGLYPDFQPPSPWAEPGSVFDLIRSADRLVYHPFESFDASVTRFISEAAEDPDVLSIKITLYRTGPDSPFAAGLLKALRNGKDVAVFVELKARFDEASNIGWTRRILEAGGHVVYGVVGFKAHAKVALVVRREGDDVRRYVHVGTGNYNAVTARVYTDLGLFSADPALAADVSDFFNELTGSAGPPVKRYRRLLVAPTSLAQELGALVEREIAHAAAGRAARIVAKVNGLTDRRMVRALYRASEAGVEVDLIVRSSCCLRPGVPGLSSRVRVRSILGRFLEHARIYYFEDGGAGAYYISSADWRKRNLRKRVEVAAPVDDPRGRARLQAILDAEFADPRAWIMRPDGAYQRLQGDGPSAQERFLREASGAAPGRIRR